METRTPEGVGYSLTTVFTSLLLGGASGTNWLNGAICELPLEQLQFTIMLNGAGAWSAEVNLNDPTVQGVEWQRATRENLSAVFVYAEGQPVYCGLVQSREYDSASGRLKVSGTDWCGYLSQRLVRKTISSSSVEAMAQAKSILSTMVGETYSPKLGVESYSTGSPTAGNIPFATGANQYPSMLNTVKELSELEYKVGFDFYSSPVTGAALRGGGGLEVVKPSLVLEYPYAGASFSASQWPMVDGTNAIALRYVTHGATQAWRVVSAGSNTGKLVVGIEWAGAFEPPASRDAYPYLEKVAHSPAKIVKDTERLILKAAAKDEISRFGTPPLTMVTTFPLSGTPALLEVLPVGRVVRFAVPASSQNSPVGVPLFPEGKVLTLRSTQIDVKVPTEGIRTMEITLSQIPGEYPVELPF